MPDHYGKEECRAGENYCTRSDAEVFKVFTVSAEYRYDDKELKQDHERHARPRYKRGYQVPFDGDAVIELGMQLIRYECRTPKIGVVTMGAIAEKRLLNIPVLQNEIRIDAGHRSTVSRGIRPNRYANHGNQARE